MFFQDKMVFEKLHFLESELLIWSQLCCVYEGKKAVLSYSLVSLLVCTQLEQRDTEPDMEMRWKINSTGCEMLVNSQLMFTAAHSCASHGMVQCMVVSEEAFEEHGTCLMPLHCLTDVKWRGISRMYIWRERTATLEIGALLVLEGSRFPFLLIIAICNDPPSMSQLLLKSVSTPQCKSWNFVACSCTLDQQFLQLHSHWDPSSCSWSQADVFFTFSH